jgi:uncharacterized protein
MKATLGAGLGLLAAGSYALGVEPVYRLNIVDYALTPPNWVKGHKMTIAVVADIHAGGYNMPLSRVDEIVERTNNLKPDLTLYLGDSLANYSTFGFINKVGFKDVAQSLSRLKAPLGVYGVLGNHDWWDDNEAQLRLSGPTISQKIFSDHGIEMMENDAVKLTHKGKSFWLGGLGDQMAFPARRARARGIRRGVDDLQGTLDQMKGRLPIIMMAHEPVIFRRMPDRVSLTIAGHTHGGQVNLFGFRPTQYFNTRHEFLYGHYINEGRNLIVTGGLGCSHVPIRIGQPPEIVHITLG